VIWTRPRAVVEPQFRTQLRGWLPRRVLRRAAGGPPRIRLAARCRRVFRPALHSGIDVLNVLTIDMRKGLPAVDSDAVMAGGQTVYASRKALYVATPSWTADGPLVAERTLVHKFAASAPDATSYSASGRIDGTLLNQFSLSEHDAVLRAATTVGAGPEGESRVTTLGRAQDPRLLRLPPPAGRRPAAGRRAGRQRPRRDGGGGSRLPRARGEAWPVRRSLIVGGRLVTISDVGIEHNSLTDLSEEAWLAFPRSTGG
jgi:hypothetical protein